MIHESLVLLIASSKISVVEADYLLLVTQRIEHDLKDKELIELNREAQMSCLMPSSGTR